MKNKIIISFIMVFVVILLNPINSYAKENNEELLKCTYYYKNNQLNYIINKNSVDLAFDDKDIINDKPWYNSDKFSVKYLKASKTGNNQYTCPTITIEERNDFVTVFLNVLDNDLCSGSCISLNAKVEKISNNVETVEIIDTKIGSSVGKYQSKSFAIPYFRKLSDGNTEWSIDGNDFYNTNNSIRLDNNNIIYLDSRLVEKIFTDSDKSIELYRCILKNGATIQYKLSLDENYCDNKVLSNKDNQGNGAIYYKAALGADDDNVDENLNADCNTILGDPNDKDSVAWLLQHILNYLRILGPMIVLVMSIVDFSKVIIAGDDEALQKTYKKLISRFILMIALFFVPTLVMVLLDIFGLTDDPICGLE